MPPTYEYDCPVHGKFDLFQSIKDTALSVCPKIGAQGGHVSDRVCGEPVRRLISGGCGVLVDASRCYDTLPPRFPGDVREAKTDLPKNRAKLIGIPREERKKYERLYY